LFFLLLYVMLFSFQCVYLFSFFLVSFFHRVDLVVFSCIVAYFVLVVCYVMLFSFIFFSCVLL